MRANAHNARLGRFDGTQFCTSWFRKSVRARSRISQQATKLSGGDGSGSKRARELPRRATWRTLYILDELTTGLHFKDVRKLLEVLHALVEQGNMVVVIEHNLEVIKTADWVIDLGPEGGDKGGEIVAEGTPEQVAKNPAPTQANISPRSSPRIGI